MLVLQTVTLLILYGHIHGAAIENDDNIVYFSDRFANTMKKHCLKNANESKYEEALEGLHDFVNCWELVLPRRRPVGEEFYKYCIKGSEEFISCLDEFVEKLTPCLGPEESYLQTFIVDGYGDYNHYFCKNLQFALESKSRTGCGAVFDKHPEMDPLIACYKNSSIFGDESVIDTVTKSELCRDILKVRKCNNDIFAEHCPEDTHFYELRNQPLANGLRNCLGEIEDEDKIIVNDTSTVPNNNIIYFTERLSGVIRQHCLQNADEAKSQEALDGLLDFQRCWQLALPYEKLTGEKLYKYCIKNSGEFTTCLNTFVEKLSPCLAPQEDYMKSFIVDSYGDYNQHFCKYLELLSVSETTKKSTEECLTNFDENPQLNPLIACYTNSSIFGDVPVTRSAITKTQLCADILDIRCCYDEMFVEHCPQALELEELHRALLTQSLGNCLDVLVNVTEDTTNDNWKK